MGNTYSIHGQDLRQFGLLPAKAPISNLALSGAWDMPSRTGKTHHIWPDDNSVEPYLRADEIFFSGRNLTFHFYVKANDRRTAALTCYGLYDLLNTFTTPVSFTSTYYGAFNVIIQDEIKIEYIGAGKCRGELIMREPVVNMSGTITTPDSTKPSVDDISLRKLGFEIVSMTDQYGRPAAKTTNVTAYGYERVKVSGIGARTINLELITQQPSYAAFNATIQNLMALLAAPNARTLIHNGITREVFAKDGFKVPMLYKNGEQYTAKVMIPLTEIRVLEAYNLLTDSSKQILIDRSGRPITEILKIN